MRVAELQIEVPTVRQAQRSPRRSMTRRSTARSSHSRRKAATLVSSCTRRNNAAGSSLITPTTHSVNIHFGECPMKIQRMLQGMAASRIFRSKHLELLFGETTEASTLCSLEKHRLLLVFGKHVDSCSPQKQLMRQLPMRLEVPGRGLWVSPLK